jgi:hypothetical protein
LHFETGVSLAHKWKFKETVIPLIARKTTKLKFLRKLIPQVKVTLRARSTYGDEFGCLPKKEGLVD